MAPKRILQLSIVLFYIGLVYFGVYHHEPWRDEAHVWMSAREYSIPTLLDNVKYEGAGALWALLLVPFAKLGFPYITMGVVHASLATAAITLLLFFSKIPLLPKVLFIFSYYMTYEYAVIARNYVLTPLLLFAIAAFYALRFIHPIPYALLVGLLAHVNSYSVGLSAALIMTYTAELLFKRRQSRHRFFALGIMTVGCFTAVLLYFPLHITPYEIPPEPFTQLQLLLRQAIVPFFLFSPLPSDFTQHLSIITTTLTAFALVAFILMFIRRGSQLMLIILMLSWFLYENMFIHKGALRHHGLLLIIIFFWWILGNKIHTTWEKMLNGIFVIALSVLLSLSIPFGGYMHYWDFRYPFTGAKDAARYIKTHNLETYPIISYAGFMADAVLPYFNHTYFWFAEYEKFGYFPLSDIRYHRVFDGLVISDVLTRVKKNFPDNQKILLLLTLPLPESERSYVLLHTSFSKYLWGGGEEFWLYTNK